MKLIAPENKSLPSRSIDIFLCSVLAFMTLPLGVDTAYAAPFAYLPNLLPAAVYVVDTATNQISATVPLPSMSNPFAAAIDPDGKKVYITGQNGFVFILDTATNTVAANPITVGSLTAGIAITPDGKHAYVASQYTSTVSVIDTATDNVSATIQFSAGATLQNIAITPDGQRAYVTAQAANAVFVIDTSTNTEMGAPIAVGSSPLGIAISPDGKEIYVTHSDTTAFVSVIDAASNAVVATIASSPNLFGVTVTPDGKFAYATGGGGVGYTQVIDTSTHAIVSTIPQGGNAVDITADGKQAYLSAPYSMSVVDTATNTLTSTISGLSLAQNVSARPLPPGIPVPNVVGEAQAAATSAITAAGLAIGTVTQQSSTTVSPSNVIHQDPPAGALEGSGAAINLVVSSGVAVPNLVGETQSAATTAITGAALVVGLITQQSSNSVAAGGVISQSPAAGTNVAGGSAVNLVVSSGAGGGSGGGYSGGGGGGMDWLTLGALLGFLFVPASAYRKSIRRGS